MIKDCVRHRYGYRLWLVLVCVWANAPLAETYSNRINDSSWQSTNSVLACSMVHEVPYYGEIVFRTRAGEASGVYLKAKTSRFRAGEASVVATSPVWASNTQAEVIATVGMKQGTRPLWLGSRITEQMLAKLKQGMNIELQGEAWYKQPAPPAKLQVSTIGFQTVYEQYLACLPGLIPRNFDQLKRTALVFPAGMVEVLPRSVAVHLDRILELVKYDDRVRVFFIDGHADSVGDRDENLELSKLRADLVAGYLIRRGIPEDWITLRWHGERYPVASNATAAGRAKNRRVTVRLERAEEIEVLPLASSN